MTERQAVKLSSMQSSVNEALHAMGFSVDDAARAVAATGGTQLDAAVNYLLKGGQGKSGGKRASQAKRASPSKGAASGKSSARCASLLPPWLTQLTDNARTPPAQLTPFTERDADMEVDAGGAGERSAKAARPAAGKAGKGAAPGGRGGAGGAGKKEAAAPAKKHTAKDRYWLANKDTLLKEGASFGEVNKRLEARWTAFSQEEKDEWIPEEDRPKPPAVKKEDPPL
ncbi:hypothetical protein T484DRAFT_1884963 [Baffinella frigidus]|nr:hypothetical protein T484DRAFT_1884963 [Cryptophyta sp. CCMP2293]